jgi:uncharacterized protein
MPVSTDKFDLGSLQLTSGEGRRLDLQVAIEPFELAGEWYRVDPPLVPARLDLSRTTGAGYAMRLRLQASLSGPCMRCLQPTAPTIEVDSREVSQQPDDSRAARSGAAGSRAGGRPEEAEELESPYLQQGVLDVGSWVRDALALALPATLLCRPECAGLCPVCGIDLNTAPTDDRHEPDAPDPRWAKLSELRFE